MKGVKLRKIFVSIISTITIMTGALLGSWSGKANLSFAAVNTENRDNIIRIGSWYTQEDLKYLKAYLVKTFPDYKFEFEYIAKSNYEPIMDSKLSYKGAPDIIYVDQEMAEKHARTGYILNLTDMCGDFTDEGRLAFEYGNAVYAVPNTSQFVCIYYNKDLLEKAKAPIPVSFESFLASCDYLRLVAGVQPVIASLEDPYDVADSALGVLSANYFSTDRGSGFGGRLQYGRTTFQEELHPYMGDWEELLTHMILTKKMYVIDNRTAVEKFVGEQAAMIVGGPDIYKAVIEANPDMNIGTLPFYGTNGARKAIIGGCDVGIAINANSMNPERAKEVVESLTTYEGQMALWKDRPGSQTYLKDTSFKNGDEFRGIESCYRDGLVFTPWMDWSFELNKQVHYKLGRELQKVLLNRETMEDAFDNVDALVKDILQNG
ncbi:ABC transporter substrate-binding protein [Butyrivibrio sp. AE2032]|uniref:ABC transporter substrate-binding protein n=1 Tax=Butyrivibrio sp. AE2032 TaxID=1458463 RepID=UPI00055180DC|nr:extracellular solute-binding protein [Butyrivibrio sp. AE2032]